MIIIAFLSPITNYVHNKKCAILEKYSDEEDRQQYASNWVQQTQIYGNFVRNYLNVNSNGENEGEDFD